MKIPEVKNLLLLSLLYGETAKKIAPLLIYRSVVTVAIFLWRSVKTRRSICCSQSNLTATYYNRQSFKLAASQTQAL
jgi:hypothetical protein